MPADALVPNALVGCGHVKLEAPTASGVRKQVRDYAETSREKVIGVNGLSARFSIVWNSGYYEKSRPHESESTSKKNEIALEMAQRPGGAPAQADGPYPGGAARPFRRATSRSQYALSFGQRRWVPYST